MKITIFGTGYVGLITGLCFAEMGNHVTCIDVDVKKISRLNEGHPPIFEPGIESLLTKNLQKGYIDFSTEPANAVKQASAIFIAVGTPPEEDGSADLQYVLEVAKTIACHLNEYKVIVNKSTVPVGTADKVKNTINQILEKNSKQVSFDVVSNPEFLKEGAAISDCMKPDRIIIGSESERAIDLIRSLYLPFSRNHEKLIVMDTRSAEMTKYVANAMLATKISFMNEMSQLAERVGADIEKIRVGIGSDKRIGPHFIYAGCGFGGSCFPKDIRALKKIALDVDYEPHMVEAIEQVNTEQKQVLFDKVRNFYRGNLQGKTVAIWGLAFKPNTDDIREAPARDLIERLWQHGANVRVYDPEAMQNFEQLYGVHDGYQLCDNAYEALETADCLCVVTEWMEFRSPDFMQIANRLADKAVFDGRNLYDKRQQQVHGLHYFSIGR